MSDLYALLIGVDYYFPNRLPDGGFYPSLGGCVRDVLHVEKYLTDYLRLPSQQIRKLTISKGSATGPQEPDESWPTYENMVTGLQWLYAESSPGDQVYIHYSGHGGRAATAYPQLKGDSGLDEALVPTDIGSSEARYLRDVELRYLLQEMVAKGLVVTVVFDSCHSGGATRGVGSAVPRGISSIDTTVRPTTSLVAPTDQLVAQWRQAAGVATRAAKPASGWLLEPAGYTFLAACRASEQAFEDCFDGKESNGALTYWMLDSLRQAGSGLSYKMLHDRILAKVHGHFVAQTPQLQGIGDRTVFGAERLPTHYAVVVTSVDPVKNRVRLNAGEAHGLRIGADFAIYPHGTKEFDGEAARIATAVVSDVSDVECWAKLARRDGAAPVEEGAQAVLIAGANIQLQRRVAVVIDDAELCDAVKQEIQEHGQGFIALGGEDGSIDFQVAANNNREFELWDRVGTAISNLRPSLRIDDRNSLRALVGRLVHLSKYRSVQELDLPDRAMQNNLRIELARVDGAQQDDGSLVFHPGDKVKLSITNTQSPGKPNDPALILNVCVLDLQADWSISQVYPAGAGSFEPLDPGQTIPLEFETYLPEGYRESVDILKVFATRATTSFRWLELPALDQPPVTRTASRAATDPLEQLLAQLTDTTAAARSVRLTSAPANRGWTVAQVELRVEE